MRISHFNAKRAFTLLEVIIAIALFAFVMIAIYATWSSILRSSKLGRDSAIAIQRSRIAIKAVEESLLTAQMYAENGPRYYAFDTNTKDENFHFLSCVSHLPRDFPGSGLFPHDQMVRRITFEVRQGEGGTNNLVMSQIPVLQVTNELSQPYEVTLVRSVSAFWLEFWDENKGYYATDWLLTNQLPKKIRVTIGTGTRPGEFDLANPVQRVIALPASTITRDIQVP